MPLFDGVRTDADFVMQVVWSAKTTESTLIRGLYTPVVQDLMPVTDDLNLPKPKVRFVKR